MMRVSIGRGLALGMTLLSTALLLACSYGEEPAPNNAIDADATSVAATIVASGPTAIARATASADAAENAYEASTPTPDTNSSDEEDNKSEGARSETRPTPDPPQVTVGLDGPDQSEVGTILDIDVRVTGEPAELAAFNFDIVYDQRLVTVEPPRPAILSASDREFRCDLPPASGDVDPNPNVGRARLVCFSFGGPQASAPRPPATLARLVVHAVASGVSTLRLENVAVFTPDAQPVSVASSQMRLEVRERES